MRSLKSPSSVRQDYICTACDYVGPRIKIKRGAIGWEIFWWVLFPIGPFYTLWRMFSKVQGCPRCGERVMVAVLGQPDEQRIKEELSDENLAKIPDMWAKDRQAYKQQNDEHF